MPEENNLDYNSQYTVPQGSGEMPQELRKWNWGAFTFNIVWGIGNKVYITLLMLVPLLNIVWIFICGAKGNEWAWKAGDYKNAEDFRKVQDTWNRAGFVFFIVFLVCIVLEILFFVSAGTALMSQYMMMSQPF